MAECLHALGEDGKAGLILRDLGNLPGLDDRRREKELRKELV
jgi:hypothetical protein